MVYTYNQREDVNTGLADYGKKIIYWNGGLLTLGYCWNSASKEGISLTYSDTLGVQIWKKNIYHPYSNTLQGNDIIAINNHSFYVTGIVSTNTINQYDAFFAKYDSRGDSIFYNYYNDPGTNWATQLYQKSSDSLFILTKWKLNYFDANNKYTVCAIDTAGNNIDTIYQSSITLKQADQIFKKGNRYYIGGITSSSVFIDVFNPNFVPVSNWYPSTTMNERFERIFEWNGNLYLNSEVSVSVPTSANDYWQVRIKQLNEVTGVTLQYLDIGPPNLFWSVASNPVFIDGGKLAILESNEVQNYCYIIDSSLSILCSSNLWAPYMSNPGLIDLTPGKKIAGTGYVSSFLGFTQDHWLFITENIETFYIDSCSNFLEINESETLTSSVNIYPNPTNDIVNLDYKFPENNEKATVNIYNYAGVLIKSFNIYGNQGKEVRNISELPNGLYIFSIISNNTQISQQKIIVSK